MDSSIFYIIVGSIIVLFFAMKKYRMRGIPQYSPAEARERVNAGSLLLDVRTTAERKQSSISGSIHIPVADLSAKLRSLDKYKSRELIVFCASGSRSAMAAVQLKRAGFSAANLKGGISSWNFSNL